MCGTIRNNTNRYVKVCLAWAASGTDQAYQPGAHCARGKAGYVRPHSTYGGHGVDIDAFYIPQGTTYSGSWHHFLGGSHRVRWAHIQSGRWKFATDVTVVIDRAS